MPSPLAAATRQTCCPFALGCPLPPPLHLLHSNLLPSFVAYHDRISTLDATASLPIPPSPPCPAATSFLLPTPNLLSSAGRTPILPPLQSKFAVIQQQREEEASLGEQSLEQLLAPVDVPEVDARLSGCICECVCDVCGVCVWFVCLCVISAVCVIVWCVCLCVMSAVCVFVCDFCSVCVCVR